MGVESNSIKNWKLPLAGSYFQKTVPYQVREEVPWPFGQEIKGPLIPGKGNLKKGGSMGVGGKLPGAHQAAEGVLP